MEKLKNLWAKVKLHKKQAIVGVVVVAAISAGLVIYNHGNSEYTVDLNQLYKIECSGHSGEGKPSITTASGLDKESFIKNILLKLYPNSSNDYIKYNQYKDFLSLSSIKFEFNKKENLSNGDEITATASYDKAQAKTLKLNLKNTTLKTTVSDLYELIDGNTPFTENLKKDLDSEFETKISNFKPSKSESLDYHSKLGEEIEEKLKNNIDYPYDSYLYFDIESININTKYILSSKDDKSNASKVVYLYDLKVKTIDSILGVKSEYDGKEESFVVALTGSDLYYSPSKYPNINTKKTDYSVYNNLDEAKQKILDQSNYDTEQF